MNWRNVKLIFLREVRDQMRDRRTLFMIAVLPMLLYPLVGMCLMQVGQFIQHRPGRVLVIGLPEIAGLPPLVNGDQFAARLFTSPKRTDLLKVEVRSTEPAADESPAPQTEAASAESATAGVAAPADAASDGDSAGSAGSDNTPRASTPAEPSAPEQSPHAVVGSDDDSYDALAEDEETMATSEAAQAGAQPGTAAQAPSAGQLEMQRGQFEVVVEFPPDFSERLEAFRAQLRRGSAAGPAEHGPGRMLLAAPRVPAPRLYYNSAKDSSQLAYMRVNEVLTRWIDSIGRQNLAQSRVPATAAKPFTVEPQDVAASGRRNAAQWSKILPFVLLLWALTGSFYPAIDLCAGEKERGTLETLLSSPAERKEIVWGKLLTIMLFSVVTALLNLGSSGITGLLVAPHMDIGPPPLSAIVWLLLALLPTSALFSGLCLSLAAFARSTKEGQYYLMPLVLITMPLTILPMAPGVDLNLGNSLIPVTGMLLLLRTLIDGEYAQALPYVPIVVGVTITCCLLAVRWAADQFNSESVLFREGERLEMGIWLRHLHRDRENTPSVGQAVLCGVLILTIKFFMSLAVSERQGFVGFAQLVLVMQIACFAAPALLMAVILTRSPAQTLLLRKPVWMSLPAAALLALCVHPLMPLLGAAVKKLYPINDDIQRELGRLLDNEAPLWGMLLVMALVPAICEELTFRGFILSGLRHMGHKWRAIVISSIFFGVAHSILQQSLTTCLIGMVIGFIAVQTGSFLPGIVFHFVHNGLLISAAKLLPDWLAADPARRIIATATPEGEIAFSWQVTAAAVLAGAALLVWFQRLNYVRSEEEELQEAIEQQAAQPVG